jgi:hypothetical protein
MTLVAYTFLAHLFLGISFQIAIQVEDKKARVPLLALIGPCVATIVFFGTSLWVLLDHNVQSGT